MSPGSFHLNAIGLRKLAKKEDILLSTKHAFSSQTMASACITNRSKLLDWNLIIWDCQMKGTVHSVVYKYSLFHYKF